MSSFSGETWRSVAMAAVFFLLPYSSLKTEIFYHIWDMSLSCGRETRTATSRKKKLEKKEGKGGEKERSKKGKRPRREKDIAKLSFFASFHPLAVARKKSEEEFAAAFFLPLFSQTFLSPPPPFQFPTFATGERKRYAICQKKLCKKVQL